MIPEDISDAIARGDRQAVKAWLNAEDSDLNSRSVDGPTLLGKCVMAAAESRRLVAGCNSETILENAPASPSTAQVSAYVKGSCNLVRT